MQSRQPIDWSRWYWDRSSYQNNMQQSSMQQRENLVQSATDTWNLDACWELPPVSQHSTCRRVSHEGVPDVLTYGSWTCISQHIFQVSKGEWRYFDYIEGYMARYLKWIFQQSEVLFNHLCYFEYFHMGRCSFFLNYTFAEQTFPCYLPLLATLSDFDVKKTKRPKGWNHHSRRWPTWLYGAQCQILCLYHLLLHSSYDNSFFFGPGELLFNF